MEEKETSVNKPNRLWTRDFTIITLGSIVSMFGNSMSGYAMSLLVLDYTSSTLLYALYIVIFTVPQLIMPIFSGALLDRFSRKKMIYTLDFISTGLYLIAAIILGTGWFNFAVFALFCFLVGSINSIYWTAYSSFYPLLISEGNYQKAYSISSTLESFTIVMIPIATFIYKSIGISLLLAINSLCFLIAAIMETQIKAKEEYIEKQKENIKTQNKTKQMFIDIKEGFKYLISEKALFAIAIYFTFSSLCGGANEVVVLPYFKANIENGEYMYIIIMAGAVLGRALAGLFHYIKKMPVKYKFTIALVVYITINIIEGTYLFLPIWGMFIFCLFSGLLGVTSYTIRVSATQKYVPDEKKGRFNGAFNLLNTLGLLVGEIVAGALSEVFDVRMVLLGFYVVGLIAAIIFIGGNKKHIEVIYNTES